MMDYWWSIKSAIISLGKWFLESAVEKVQKEEEKFAEIIP